MGRVGENLRNNRKRVKRRAAICCSVLVMMGMILSVSGCANVDLKNFIELMTEQFNNPQIKWVKSYGAGGFETVWAVENGHDSGYIFAGYSDSFPSIAPTGGAWVVKVNNEGVIQWQRKYGGVITIDAAYDIYPTADGGYIVAVIRDGMAGLLKLTVNGSVSWAKTYDETDLLNTWTLSVQQTVDSGYVLCGTSEFVPGEDFLMVWKFNTSGVPEWRAKIGAAMEEGYSIQQTSDSGYIVCGSSWSQFNNGAWILKLASGGAIDWQYVYGASYYIYDIQQTSDGGYIGAGMDVSTDANGDLWVLKLNGDGSVQWQKRYGKQGPYERAWSVGQTADGGYVITGQRGMESFQEAQDVWVLRLDPDGRIRWQKTYGGTDEDYGFDVRPTEDGGFIVAGDTVSFAPPLSFEDILLIKLDGDGNPVFSSSGPDRFFGVDTDVAAQSTGTTNLGVSVPYDVSVTATSSSAQVFQVENTTAVERVLFPPTY